MFGYFQFSLYICRQIIIINDSRQKMEKPNTLYKRCIGIAVLLLLTVISATAFPIKLYDNRLLTSNLITALCQDPQGYVWIGTEYGLNKFDGVHVTQYYNDDTQPLSLSDDIIRCLMTDSSGRVWVVNNKGVQRYNRMTNGFESVMFDDGPLANIYDILQTPDGHIWLLSAKVGVLGVNESLQAKPIKKINQHVREECNNMFLDSKGRLWIGYNNAGLLMIDMQKGKKLFFEKMTADSKPAIDIIEDKKNRIQVLTYDAVVQFNEQEMAFEPIVSFHRNNVRHFYYDSHGQLFIGTSGSGLWKANLENGEVERVNNRGCLDLPYEKVYAFMEDRDGNYWIGCSQKGLLLYSEKENPFHYLPLNQMASNNGNVLRSVFADNEGNFLVCQERGGIAQINTEGQVLCQWMKDYTVMTVYDDGQGSFWVGTFRNGMFRINTKDNSEEALPLTENQRIGSITRDHQGNLYTAVFNNGLHSYTPDGKTERVLGKGSLNLINIFLNTLFTDKDGRIWIGHYYGIDVYDPETDRLIDVNVAPDLRPAIVYAIGQSRDGDIWVGSSKGLFRYSQSKRRAEQWKRYTTKNGLPNNNVCGMVVSGDDVWVSTYRGLGKIDSKGTIVSYILGNGLQDWTYLRCAYAHSTSGEIVIGNQNGITWFLPEKIGNEQFERGITLTGMRWGDEINPINIADDITVDFQDNTFSLLFSTMDFRDAQNVHYEYRFEDEQKNKWHQTDAGVSEIFLSRLSVGSHHLQVRAYDNGVWSPVKTLTIHVTPPWYRTWWAYLLYLIILLVIGALWWRSYWNRRQAETNEEKIKFFVDISHELRSPLTLIKSPLEQLLKEKQDATTTRALRNMERSTNRLLTLTDQILSIRKMEKGQLKLHFVETCLGDLIADICHDYDFQVEQRQIRLSFENQAPDMMVWIDPDQFDKVVSNLLGNAIKYVGDGGYILVSLLKTYKNQAELCICDNGPGIDEAQLRKVFERFYQASAQPTKGQMSYGIGLNLTYKIVSLHGGSIVARNRSDGQGSIFVVRLPLGYQHLPKEQVDLNHEYVVQDKKSPVPVITDGDAVHRIRRKTDFRVAVVDDDEELRYFLKTELKESYRVDVYPDGEKALEGIASTLPDIVVSDVVMPKMDGVELLKRIKANTKICHIPVILLTSKTDHQSRIESIVEGADAYIKKPFSLDELQATIISLIKNRKLVRGKFSGMQEQADMIRQIELKGNDAALMEKIMKAVNSRMDDSDFNVGTLSEEVGLSRTQLHRRMKELTGISVGEFIRNLRLQQAAKLLAAGDVSVSQVTYAVGFSTPGHFAVAFKKYFGSHHRNI